MMNRLIKLISLTLLIGTVSVSAERDVTFKSEVRVEGRFVLLKDLILSNDKILEDELDLIVLEAPERGSKRYSPVSIAYKMQEHKALMDLVISSPPTVKVVRLTDADFIESVRASLVKQLKALPQWKDFNINLVFESDDLISLGGMSGSETFEITSQNTSRNMSNVKLRVNFSEKGKSLGSISLNPRIQRELDMVILRDSLKKGDVITRSNIQVVKTWSDGREADFCLTLEEAVGYEARKNLPEGSKIPVNYLADPIYARKGQIISVRSVVGPLNITIDAKTLQQGRRGDIIRVQNTFSKRILAVKLVGDGIGVINSGGR
ncbi:MAG: flagellar basal body P-ring formation chaperone FlgA [Lentisphaeraceae bacterium]|nr:flagellar basal body P-ring formation chaperone FlgA [Lentisphaeraceae bacterium]